jgi:hypothetical protein
VRTARLQTALPKLLAPWQGWLKSLAFDIAKYLAENAGRLDCFIGPSRPYFSHSTHLPEGLGGLAQRGSYERLSMSEWLLADELPEEFLRRAVMHEHLFLAPEQRGPKVKPRILFICDAGPQQLGSPRLAHICLWIAISRRAQRQQAEFSWCVAQAAPTDIRVNDEPESLRALLNLRTAIGIEASHLETWAGHLHAQHYDEIWWIARTVPPKQSAGKRLRWVAIDEPLELCAPRLRLSMDARELFLPLPDAKLAARILRDPLAHMRVAPQGEVCPQTLQITLLKCVGISLQHAPILSSKGTHLAVATLDGKAIVIAIPAREQRKPAKVVRIDELGEILAASLEGGKLCRLSQLNQHWYLTDFGGPKYTLPQLWLHAPMDQRVHLPCGTGRWQCALGDSGQWAYVLDRTAQLLGFNLKPLTANSPPKIIATQVLALERCGPQTLIAFRVNGDIVFAKLKDGAFTEVKRMSAPSAGKIVFSAALNWQYPAAKVMFLMLEKDGQIRLCFADNQFQTLAPTKYSVQGLLSLPLNQKTLNMHDFLLGRASDHFVLMNLAGEVQETIQAYGEIVQCSLSSNCLFLTWTTQNRDVYVYSFSTKSHVLRAKAQP